MLYFFATKTIRNEEFFCHKDTKAQRICNITWSFNFILFGVIVQS